MQFNEKPEKIPTENKGSQIENAFARRRKEEKEGAPGFPDFFSYEKGELFVRFIEDTDVTDNLLDFLHDHGKRLPDNGNMPKFLYVDGDKILMAGIDTINCLDEWEKWFKNCPPLEGK